MKYEHLASFFLWRYRTWTACDGDRVRSCKTAAEMGTNHWAGSRGDFPSSWKLHFFISNQVKRSFAKKEKEGEWGLNIKRVKVHLKERRELAYRYLELTADQKKRGIAGTGFQIYGFQNSTQDSLENIEFSQFTDYFLDLANFYILSEEAHIGVLWFRLGLARGWQEGLGPWRILILVCFDSE